MSSSLAYKPVGLLMCQANPFLKSFTSKVVSCLPCESEKDLFEVVLEDTILFPEGGGQPYDLGLIDNQPVSKVLRKGLTPIHYLGSPIQVGKSVDISLDFKRRFDYMQQHSGQHLISAILENEYKLDTVSWELGKLTSFIELQPVEGIKLTDEIVKQVEQKCNDAIINCTPVSVVTSDMSEIERPESLPDDYDGGVIRHIVIDGIDNNPCCGTHVTNLSYLQSIKLCQPETGRKGTIRLPFLVGLRVLEYLDKSLKVEKQLNNLLSTSQDDFSEAVDRLIKQRKEANKVSKNLFQEISEYVAKSMFTELSTTSKNIVTLHREDAPLDFIFSIFKTVLPLLEKLPTQNNNSEPKAVVVSAGPIKTGGPIIVFGTPDLVSKISSHLLKDIPELKGGGKGSKWQGKSSSWSKLSKSISSLPQ
ncbi:hypothetical protein BB560_004920 [Smittium megazygosporum]|uniref:Uncharacterized protein n=1 Tax=Smittium megazygosporum TaxID=133381 RepID=A0A2T9Z818_9FUNG|nr:hypothetical protein BB560_004920 [Smittium megazygosporum]